MSWKRTIRFEKAFVAQKRDAGKEQRRRRFDFWDDVYT